MLELRTVACFAARMVDIRGVLTCRVQSCQVTRSLELKLIPRMLNSCTSRLPTLVTDMFLDLRMDVSAGKMSIAASCRMCRITRFLFEVRTRIRSTWEMMQVSSCWMSTLGCG